MRLLIALRRAWPLAFFLAPLLWAAAQWATPRHGPLRVIVLDVGQGDCILVETPTGHTLLVDGGGSNDESQVDSTNVGERVVVPFLHHEGITRLDLVLLTHPHGDHCGGLTAVLREEQVGAVLDGTVLPYPSADYTLFRQEIAQRHIPYTHAARGMQLAFGDGVTGQILNPPASGTPYGTNPNDTTVNNYSAVLRLGYGRTHVLLTGDAEFAAEQNMVAAGEDVRADALKVGHHGAANATSDAWLAQVQPAVAVISCGAHNPFGHPSPATVARLAGHHVMTYCTAWNGAVVLTSDGQRLIARPYTAGGPPKA